MGSPVGRVGAAFAGAGLLARSGSALGCAVAEQGTEGAEAVQDRAFSDTLSEATTPYTHALPLRPSPPIGQAC